jgi:hypothetical protein
MKKARLFGVVIFLLIFGVGGYILQWSQLFSVKSFGYSISGKQDPNFNLEQYFNQEISTHGLTVKLKEPVAKVNVGGIASTIMQNSFVEEVNTSRGWRSGKIEIYVKMRNPVAQLINNLLPTAGDTSTALTLTDTGTASNKYIDEQGNLFSSPLNYGSLPGIELPATDNSPTSLQNSVALQKLVTQLVPQLPNIILHHLLGIQIFSTTDIEIMTNLRKPTLRINYGDGTQLAIKGEVTTKLLALPVSRKISAIDLTDPSAPILTQSGHFDSGTAVVAAGNKKKNHLLNRSHQTHPVKKIKGKIKIKK